MRKNTTSRPSEWGGGRVVRFLSACAEGCYKHFVNGRWICCKCKEFAGSEGGQA